ncbi:MAG: RluA family pseudouridine synthase [Planctomycetales bacterium]|jgi:23S rRNA pseudouridine1911/1915/1917 synthase
MSELSANEAISITVEARAHGWRIDHYLARLYPNYSRSAFQKAITQEAVLLNGLPAKTGRRLRVNDTLSVKLPKESDSSLLAEDIPLEILYEDDSLVVLNKAAGMIVHPGRGNYHGTMAGALQFHFDQLSDMAGQLRPGIVHRLDRDTTGVIIVAKDNQIHSRLSSQFEKREVTKEYRALVWGGPDFDSDLIETHMSVHPGKREKMQVCQPGGNSRDATTWYEVIQRFQKATYVRLLPKTGRTHQLRVHMNHLGHPILADSLYRGRSQVTEADLNPALTGTDDSPILIQRQALHARRLTFRHPLSGKEMTIEAPLPEDMQATLNYLESLAH